MWGSYLTAVLKRKPESEVAAALCVLGVREDDGALSGPVQSCADTANCGPEYDEPSIEKHVQ